MLTCFAASAEAALPVRVVKESGCAAWLAAVPDVTRGWLQATGFGGKGGNAALLPGGDGALAGAVLVAHDRSEPWDAAALYGVLPAGSWRLDDPEGALPVADATLGWALASYRFGRYLKEETAARPLLWLPEGAERRLGCELAEATWLARDLINTPASDLGPEELAAAVTEEGRRQGAAVEVVSGEALASGYPAIHTVGRASTRAPRLVDLRWGDPTAPRLTLVGKGVCFDTGGLDLKPSSGMLLMKKDMGGAATMLALARMVMAQGLKVRLRLLVPTVENSVAGDAFRPGDVIRMRGGSTVEIGNTDAEGRLILADALTDACAEEPVLLMDAATLTGAARVALGPELPALFTPDDGVAAGLLAAGEAVGDPLWRLPLHQGYRAYIKSSVADINNAGSKPLAGAITAALFLQHFVAAATPWAHFDLFAWNEDARPGRPRGGEATGLRAMWAFLDNRFGRG